MSDSLGNPIGLSKYLALFENDTDRLDFIHEELGSLYSMLYFAPSHPDMFPVPSAKDVLYAAEQIKLLGEAIAIFIGVWDGKPHARVPTVAKTSSIDEFTEFVRNMPRVTKEQVAAYDAALSSEDETQSD